MFYFAASCVTNSNYSYWLHCSWQSNFFGELRKTHLFCKRAYRRWRSYKVIDFGTNRRAYAT